MTLNRKVMKKSSKEGFTLVELVIVIAILAILAAIAVPVITTAINSSKLSVMKTDGESLEYVVKECLAMYKADLKTTTYGKRNVNASAATIADVCYTNQLDIDDDSYSGGNTFFKRTFGGKTYEMVFFKGNLCLFGDGENDYGTPVAAAKDGDCVLLSADTKIADLDASA